MRENPVKLYSHAIEDGYNKNQEKENVENSRQEMLKLVKERVEETEKSAEELEELELDEIEIDKITAELKTYLGKPLSYWWFNMLFREFPKP